MKNGDLDSKGLLASIIQSEGTVESFKVRFLSVVVDKFLTALLLLWPETNVSFFLNTISNLLEPIK